MELIEKIYNTAKGMPQTTIMEVCGGHTRVVIENGIRGALPKNISLVSGPGCPVCVTSQKDIDFMIALAKEGVPIATYGDMLRVPGSIGNLEDARQNSAKVTVITSTTDATLTKKHVFFGIGFETTAPMTAYLLKKGTPVYSTHKLMPPAISALAGDTKINGFLAPGHVSTIIGANAYQHIPIPQVITGFTPEKILHAIYTLLLELKSNKKRVINDYKEAVTPEGNTAAKKLMDKHFIVADAEWRGLGTIEKSGLDVRDDDLNAKKIYKDIFKKVPEPKKTACKCRDVLRGKITPNACPLYSNACTPNNPKGACMVSLEGTCRIYYEGGV